MNWIEIMLKAKTVIVAIDSENQRAFMGTTFEVVECNDIDQCITLYGKNGTEMSLYKEMVCESITEEVAGRYEIALSYMGYHFLINVTV